MAFYARFYTQKGFRIVATKKNKKMMIRTKTFLASLLMLCGITLNVLGVTKLRILNMTPALLLPVLLCKFM